MLILIQIASYLGTETQRISGGLHQRVLILCFDMF